MAISPLIVNAIPRTALKDIYDAVHALETTGPSITATGGTTSRTLASKFSDFLSIKDFGGVGNGSTDDTAAIVAAQASGLPIFFPAGTYILSPSSFTTSFCFFGMGDLSIIKWKSAAEGLAMIRMQTSALRAEFYNIKFDGNKAGHSEDATYRATLRFEAPANGTTTRIIVNNCTFINGRSYDIRVIGQQVTGSFTRAHIQQCRFYDGLEGTSSKSAQCISIADDVDLSVEECDFEGPIAGGVYRSGVVMQQTDTNTHSQIGTVNLTNNTLRNMGTNVSGATLGALDVYSGAKNVVITNNRMTGSRGRGIGVKADQSNVTVVGNTIDGLDGTYATAGITFFSSVTPDSGKRAIIALNTIYGTVGDGIFCDGADSDSATTPSHDILLISNNTIMAAGKGILVRYCGSTKITDNIIQGGSIGITASEKMTGPLSICDNDIDGTSSHAIDIAGTQTDLDVQIEDNMIADPTGRGVSLSVAVNSAQIKSNTIKNTGSVSIVVTGVTKRSVVCQNTTINCNSAFTLPSSAELHEYDNSWDPAPGFSTREVTIAGGIITITQSWHYVDTEADAATDDLDTINGGMDGRMLILRASNSARDVVIKDGTGNMKLAGDFTMNNAEDTITLLYSGGVWLELCRSDNGA